jgi:hypothetical protein
VRAVLLVLLALSGCGARPSDPVLARCEAQSDSDPAVHEAIIEANSELQEVHVLGVRAVNRARQRAVQRCLAGKGLAPLGGVEPVEHD